MWPNPNNGETEKKRVPIVPPYTGTNYYVLTVPSTTTFTLAATLGGTVISAGSAVTTAIVFSRVSAIYNRTADNTQHLATFSGDNTVMGVLEVHNPSVANPSSLRFRISNGLVS